MTSKFSENLRELRKHWSNIDKAQHQLLHVKRKNNLMGKWGRPRETSYNPCYKPLGKCKAQALVWSTIYCTDLEPRCLKETVSL